MALPKQLSFRELKKKLKLAGIEWYPSRGKGSHGTFRGEDVDGKMRSYPIPYSQQREVDRNYLKGVLRRFGVGKDVLVN